MMKKILLAIIFLFSIASFCLGSVTSDVDKSDVELSTQFDGTSILVFGALSSENDRTSLFVEIVGPPTSVYIRKKVQIWGIWVSKKIAQFQNIPSFYQISISDPDHPILEKIEYQRLKSIFYDSLKIVSGPEKGNSPQQYYSELTRLKKHSSKKYGGPLYFSSC